MGIMTMLSIVAGEYFISPEMMLESDEFCEFLKDKPDLDQIREFVSENF